MNLISLILLGIAMSGDAFAVALSKGLRMKHASFWIALKIALIFGLTEGSFTAIGYFLGSVVANFIRAFDHWIAFVMLSSLGTFFIYKAFKEGKENDEEESQNETQIGIFSTFFSSIATSLDSMTVGVSLAFTNVMMAKAVICITLSTFSMVLLAVLLGRTNSRFCGKWIEYFDGITLIIVGSTVLYEHLYAGVG